MPTRREFFQTSAAVLASSRAGFAAPWNNLTLWYRQPAAKWVEALPIGNGRLGAMVFGGVEAERLQLNEDTLWSGPPPAWDNADAVKYLPEVRRLVLEEEKYVEAGEVTKKMQGSDTEAYQPLGDLHLKFEHAGAIADYRRELDLDSAVVRVSYRAGEPRFTREIFASAPDQVMVVRLAGEKPLTFTVSLDTPHRSSTESPGDGTLALRGRGPVSIEGGVSYDEAAGIPFEARLRVIAEGGRVSAAGSAIRVEGAKAATLLLAAATGYREPISSRCERQLEAAAKKPYARLRADHVADHQRLFRRVSLELPAGEAASLPTDERLKRPDPQLAALYFQFARYLLISCSRPGTQPANLQGIWNEQVQPPWRSNYTVNINTEMNYWPAEVANLSECHEPLLRMVEELSVTGARTARTNYGLPGWVAHHNVDLWRHSGSVGNFGHDDPVWACWQMGGAWLSRHLWEHYAFTGDREFLGRRAYPVMKGAAEFCLAWLVEHQGRLVTCPSTSPENKFLTSDGRKASVSAASTNDMAIIRDLFGNVIEAAATLGIDAEFRGKLEDARARLWPYQTGSQGQLLEWWKEFAEAEPGHRHMSHLFGLHPGNQITLRGTPELAKVARTSLERRLKSGGGHTGWSRAWIINFWARLEEGDLAWENVLALLGSSTLPNLFDTHPPFQIDGNFGGAAGMAEMLLATHAGEIQFLPALPRDWADGSFRGLKARGAIEVDLEWRGGKATVARLRPARDGVVKLRPPKGQRIAGDRTSVELRAGREIVIRFV